MSVRFYEVTNCPDGNAYTIETLPTPWLQDVLAACLAGPRPKAFRESDFTQAAAVEQCEIELAVRALEGRL